QRGNGRSGRYVFCVDGVPVNEAALKPRMPRGKHDVTHCDASPERGSALPQMARLGTPQMARLTPTALPQVAMESCDSFESNESESPPSPLIIINADADEVSFETLWRSVRGERGHAGPAITQWSKLNKADRLKVGN